MSTENTSVVTAQQDATDEAWSFNGEDYNHGSLGDLIDDYRDELEPGQVVHLGTAVHPKLSHLIDANDVIETMGDRAWEIADEHAADYPSVTDEAKAELNALLEAWITKHCPPNFWTVENVREYVITAEDLAETPAAQQPAAEVAA